MDQPGWEYAGFGDRLFGDICDGVLALLFALPIWFAVDRWMLGRESRFLDDEGPIGASDVALWAWFLWNLTYLVGKTGQSWGRRIAGLKVVRNDGEPPGVWRAFGRNMFAAFISGPLLYLGFLWVIWDRDKQAWHDKVFRTYVLRRVF